MRYLKDIVVWQTVAAGVMLLSLLTGCAVSGRTGLEGMKRLSAVEVDKNKVWPYVQVLPNYRFSPECNVALCAVLFSDGGSGLYVPKAENAGSGRPADFDLKWLVPYRINDGSILYAPTASDPIEYRIASGPVNIRFGFNPAEAGEERISAIRH
jgi:hypothetical protein